MSISEPFIRRPCGTTLLSIAIALAGIVAYRFLPVAPLPNVDYPSVQVGCGLPGASPETMASSVCAPLERQFGRIAGVTEMTSTSSLGNASITVLFDLNRNIDAAARDIQAAINAARGNLPADLPSNPTYRKVNPSDAPILFMALTSKIYTRAQMYDKASSIFAQKLSQIEGVGQVRVGGSSLPGVRIEINPNKLNDVGLVLDDVRTVMATVNANKPKGSISGSDYSWTIYSTDQLFKAADYQDVIISYVKGAPVRLRDVADVVDSVEDIRTGGIFNGDPAILIIISRQPGANIIDTVDRIYAIMPELQAEIPAGMFLQIASDRTVTIRASFHDVERTLLISVILVILVVFVFLRDFRTTLIPSVAVPISLIGTFGVMYLLNYSLDNLSLMAITIATGFVVDDAIVVIENVTRHLEQGMRPFQAALLGAREIGFTVLSMSTSLIAVFIPILLMSGYVGRLFREFAVTLSVAIATSMLVSLTCTPMMCAHILKPAHERHHGHLFQASEWVFQCVLKFYGYTLARVLQHPVVTLLITLGTIGLSAWLYVAVPKGFFPQQDTGRLGGTIIADQKTSFQSTNQLLQTYNKTVMDDPSVDGVIAFAGGFGGGANTASLQVNLKDLNSRPNHESIDQVMARLRSKLAVVPGATLIFKAQQDINIGGRNSNALYQFTLQGDDLTKLNDWAPKVLDTIRKLPTVTDVTSDQQNHGLAASVIVDNDTAGRLGITKQTIDNTLYDAFGQRQVSTMYETLNQYHVVMEAALPYNQTPADALQYIYARSNTNGLVPLSAFSHYGQSTASLSVNHQGQYPAVTISFNLPPNVPLGNAIDQISSAMNTIHLPAEIKGSFQGTAKAYQEALSNQVVLIAIAILTVYIVLGMLYESVIHPVTILSTIPSAGVGALLALEVFHIELTVIATIGIILLIGIVKKNAIMMVDFAIETERTKHTSPRDAIYEACLLRFRPIMMTTMAALLGSVPLALGHGTGSELRRPLGITIIGGLIFSQALTLYTTPVIYLWLDRLRLSFNRIVLGSRPTRSPLPVLPLPDSAVQC